MSGILTKNLVLTTWAPQVNMEPQANKTCMGLDGPHMFIGTFKYKYKTLTNTKPAQH